MENEKLENIKGIVASRVDCAAHSMDHIMRVYNLCMNLARGEDVDLEVLRAAALLHDVGGPAEMADPSGKIDHAVVGAETAGSILEELGFGKEKIKHIQDCIVSHRYRTDNKPKTKEAEILFDADKLDMLGAIGIARGYAWVGKNNASFYKKINNIEEYINDNLGGKINGRLRDKTKHSVQAQYETKAKFIKDKLYTEKARQIAKERTEYFKKFLDRLEEEIEGKL